MSLGSVKSYQNVSFKGYDKRLDNKGQEVHEFYYPHSKDYKLQLEVHCQQKDGDAKKDFTKDIDDKKIAVSIPKSLSDNYNVYYRFKLTPDKNSTTLSDKEKNTVLYATDNGLIKNLGEINGSSEPFNLIYPDRKIVSKAGRMQLQLPDLYYPGVEYNDGKYAVNEAVRASVLSTVRNHVNKLGGTLNGMTYMLPEKAKEGYTRIVGTPFTKDEVSSHLYWTQNAYQMASSLGTMQDMKRFQQSLFKNGINFVTDAALVNEGLQGIHFANVMKWGEDSPFFTWFKTYNLDSNLLNLGVIPKNSDNVRMRIINSPIQTGANPVENESYDPKKPTFVQLYDARLASDEQVKSDKIFTKYEKKLDNHYDITTYDDAIIPYSFEVNPDELAKNIKKFNAVEQGDFSDIDTIKNVLNFGKFKVGDRKEGGIELWDGNVDIAKLNFSFGNYDIGILNKGSKIDAKKREADYMQGVREVQDYAVLSGKYWAKLSADTQLEFAANAFKNVQTLGDAINHINEQVGKNLPKSVLSVVNSEILSNTLNNNYNLFKLNNIASYTKIDANDMKTEEKATSYKDILTKSIMNLPLETLEVANDTSALFSSGYLTKRAATNEQIGLTRFDIYKSNYPNLPEKYSKLYKKTDKILSNNVYEFVDKVLSGYNNLDNVEKIKDQNDNITTFGKYAINAIASDLVKYALIKSMDKDANITVEPDGTLNFDNIDKEKLSIKGLNIQGGSPVDEITNLTNKIEKGINKLTSNQAEINKLSTAIAKRLNGLNENSFKLADMILDRTESGMGLRVDAAKDIAAFDSVRDGTDDVSKAMDDVYDFWSKYIKEGIHKENPHAFTTAEVTDIPSFIKKYAVGDLKSAPEAERKLLEKTGATSIANYSYFFSMPIGMYSRSPENGDWDGFTNINNIKGKIDCLDNPGWIDNSGLIFEGMPDSSIHSYTFVGNHDKPRILHVLGLDMALYNSNFSDAESQKAAQDVLMMGSDINYEDLDTEYADERPISGPAIAMGYRLKNVFRNLRVNDKNNSKEDKMISDSDFAKIEKSIARLAKGIYKVDGESKSSYFNADSFGEKPFDVVINDVIKTANLDADENQQKMIKDAAFEKMLAPAIGKFKNIYKMLTLLPGDPTDFAGDKEGLTGFESKCKNLTQQNRNAIRWEWLDANNNEYYKPFIAQYKEDMNNIMALRTRAELSALNNGHTVSLVNYDSAKEFAHPSSRRYSANFRYNSEGSQVITIFGKPDLEAPKPELFLGNTPVKLDYLNLGKVRSREGLSAGLEVGTRFANANPKDKSIYIVEKATINIPKKAPDGTPEENCNYYIDDKQTGFILEPTESYVLRRYIGKRAVPIEIAKKDDNALVLYKI